MDRATFLLTELLTELQKLNPALTGDIDLPVAGRLNLRAGNGQLVGGDALLSETALEALLDAVKALNAYAESQPEPTLTGNDTLRIFDETVTQLHPNAVTQIEDALTATADPNQIGINELHTALHFRTLGSDFIAQKHLIADIEDAFNDLDIPELSGEVKKDALVAEPLVTEALDYVFGEVHDPYADEDGGL
ncbi:hypothetical protein [Streptomyces sp. NPDC060366]|uniref:hypothetical protein n=1 Tax=Streptomyces sp. NPDC060366 TaxID=3347105 RepID=UPI00364F44B4